MVQYELKTMPSDDSPSPPVPEGLHPLNVQDTPSTLAFPDDLFANAVTSTRMAMVVSDPA